MEQNLERVEVRVKVISWNIEKVKLSEKQWDNEVVRSWILILPRDYDVLGLCLQNASRSDKLGESIGKFLGDEFDMIANDSSDVKAFLYVRRTVYAQFLLSRFNKKKFAALIFKTADFQLILASSSLDKKSTDKFFQEMTDSEIRQRLFIQGGDAKSDSLIELDENEALACDFRAGSTCDRILFSRNEIDVVLNEYKTIGSPTKSKHDIVFGSLTVSYIRDNRYGRRDFFVENANLTPNEKNYCRCVLESVANGSVQPDKAKSHCEKITKEKVYECSGWYDWDKMDYRMLRAYMSIHKIKFPQHEYNEKVLLDLIRRDKERQSGRGRNLGIYAVGAM